MRWTAVRRKHPYVIHKETTTTRMGHLANHKQIDRHRHHRSVVVYAPYQILKKQILAAAAAVVVWAWNVVDDRY